MNLMDMFDDIAGPLNLFDFVEGVIRGLAYGDLGYRFVLRRVDKGGNHRMKDAISILEQYGVDTFWYGFDSQKMYFRVKNRQARWAEYVLLHAGVELLNPTFDHRNPGYVAQHEPGWMPRPWSAGPKTADEIDSPSDESGQAEIQQSKGLLDWLDAL